VCTDQADTLIGDFQLRRKSRLPRSDSLSFDPWETIPESVGKGYGWFAAAADKKCKLTGFFMEKEGPVGGVLGPREGDDNSGTDEIFSQNPEKY
jgi:hypothetical protein